jgi:hypothetical protein
MYAIDCSQQQHLEIDKKELTEGRGSTHQVPRSTLEKLNSGYRKRLTADGSSN